MKIEWLSEASGEFRDYLLYYRNKVGPKYARAFSEKILTAVGQLGDSWKVFRERRFHNLEFAL